MKHPLTYLFVIAFALSACENQLIDPLHDDGVVISRIDHKANNETWEETFEYDNQGRLVSVTDERSLGRRRQMEYYGDQLFQVRTFELVDETLIFRDSMVRDGDGRIEAIYKFSVNGGEDVPLRRIERLYYDNLGQVIESRTETIGSSDYNPRRVYHWENGNIVKEDQYWDGTDLSVEFFFTYDNKRGVNTQNLLIFQQAGYPTRNNVISVDWTDHSGVLDTACKPCTTSYGYDAQQRPVLFSTNWGYGGSIVYKALNLLEE